MTDKQYEEYKKAKEELEPVKKFLFWCGERGYTCLLYTSPSPRDS